MKIKQDPITKLWCREDGAVLMSPGSRFNSFHWTFGSKHPTGYRTIRFRGKNYRVHVLICRAFHGLALAGKPEVDHINRIRDDNRSINLRWASRKENQSNKDYVDQSIAKYGVRTRDDKKAYNRAYYRVNREEQKAYQRAYYAAKAVEMHSKGLTYRKGPDGKWGWYPRAHS